MATVEQLAIQLKGMTNFLVQIAACVNSVSPNFTIEEEQGQGRNEWQKEDWVAETEVEDSWHVYRPPLSNLEYSLLWAKFWRWTNWYLCNLQGIDRSLPYALQHCTREGGHNYSQCSMYLLLVCNKYYTAEPLIDARTSFLYSFIKTVSVYM